jgi:hypothetical protein
VAFAAMSVADAATMTVGSQVIANGVLPLVEDATFVVNGQRIQFGAFDYSSASSMTVAGNKKWLPEGDTSESWTDISDNNESWTTISDNSESWQIAA